MRRLLAVSVLCSSLALIAATPAAPTPKPVPAFTPKPIATLAPSPRTSATPVAVKPSVIVYPFDVGGDIPKNAGNQIAQIFNQELTQSGGVTVMTPSAGVKRTDFLNEATKAHADYYISGFLTAVGDSAAMVMQVVSTTSGAMIYTKTSQIATADDAAAQAMTAREAILAHSGVLDASVAQQAASNATPAPSSDKGASVSVGGIGSLFGLLKHGKGAAAATPVPVSQKPSRVAMVARVEGANVDAGTLTSATEALKTALDRAFITQYANVASTGLQSSANAVCGNNRNATIAGGTIEQQHTGGGFHGKTEVTFTLRVYTCFGAVLYEGTATSGTVASAVQSAVLQYTSAHPENS